MTQTREGVARPNSERRGVTELSKKWEKIESDDTLRAGLIMLLSWEGIDADAARLLRDMGCAVTEREVRYAMKRGGGNKEHYLQVIEALAPPQEAFDAAYPHARKAVLESSHSRPNAWRYLPDTRAIVAHLLRHSDAKPPTISQVLEAHLAIDYYGYRDVIERAIAKAGRIPLAEVLEKGQPPYTRALESGDMEGGKSIAERSLDAVRSTQHEQGEWLMNPRSRALGVYLLLKLDVPITAVARIIEKVTGIRVTKNSFFFHFDNEEDRLAYAQEKEKTVDPKVYEKMKPLAEKALKEYAEYLRRMRAESGKKGRDAQLRAKGYVPREPEEPVAEPEPEPEPEEELSDEELEARALEYGKSSENLKNLSSAISVRQKRTSVPRVFLEFARRSHKSDASRVFGWLDIMLDDTKGNRIADEEQEAYSKMLAFKRELIRELKAIEGGKTAGALYEALVPGKGVEPILCVRLSLHEEKIEYSVPIPKRLK